MEQLPPANGTGNLDGHGHPVSDEWADAMVRTVAHLAAQLTIVQVRLRALASELNAGEAVAAGAVAARVETLARTEAGSYLRENLGEILTEVIDVEALEQDLVRYLIAESEPGESTP
ncbi:MAG: hypothetical protein M3464_06965 [Chloroflexota bacterium]|nr:hypothetical protein [Chloroflexota bacterium]